MPAAQIVDDLWYPYRGVIGEELGHALHVGRFFGVIEFFKEPRIEFLPDRLHIHPGKHGKDQL